MEKYIDSFTLKNGQTVTATVSHAAQLSAKFQIWASQYETTDAESLAMWIANQPEHHRTYFSGTPEVESLAATGFKKIEGVQIPNLDIVPASKICFAVATIQSAV